MLLALLLPDPCDEHCPKTFKEQARKILQEVRQPLDDDAGLRKALLGFIGDFANWDMAADSSYLRVGRDLVRAAHGDDAPLVVDPFAGGGSIPLEALRLRCEAFASDLNPVACLILKVMLEDIPRHGAGLADELRRVGGEIKAAAEQELADLYPADPDGATPIAYLWARTVRCEAPNCGAEIPLMRSLWLCKKARRKRALQPRVAPAEGGIPRVEFEIFEPATDKDVREGTVARARATCVCCGAVLPPERVRAQLAAQRGGADVIFDERGRRAGGAFLLAVVTLKPDEKGRHYRLPTGRDYEAVERAQDRVAGIRAEWEGGGRQDFCPVPDESIPLTEVRRISVPIYGMRAWGDLFTARQKAALVELGRLVHQHQSSSPPALLLALSVSRFADIANSLCQWENTKHQVRHLFTRQSIPMLWDFAEASFVGGQAGDYAITLRTMARVVEWLSESLEAAGQVHPADRLLSRFLIKPPTSGLPTRRTTMRYRTHTSQTSSTFGSGALFLRIRRCAARLSRATAPHRRRAKSSWIDRIA